MYKIADCVPGHAVPEALNDNFRQYLVAMVGNVGRMLAEATSKTPELAETTR